MTSTAQLLTTRVATAAVALAILAGCGSSSTRTAGGGTGKRPSCQPIYASFNIPPLEASLSDSQGACLPQKLSFTGEVAGQATVAAVSGSVCTKPLGRGDATPNPNLQVVVGGKAYSIEISYFLGFDPQHPAVAAGPNRPDASVVVTDRTQPNAPWASTRGTVRFNADGTSGSLDVTLMRDLSGSLPGHLTGDWRCGAAAAPPSPGPGPCGTIATSPGLQPEDVARLKAGPCLAEDLTLTNPVSGHAGYGVAVQPSASTSRDVPCGGSDDHHINSSVAFRIRDETFFFVIQLRADSVDPPLTTGQYAPVVPNDVSGAPSALIVAASTTWASHDGKFMVAPDRHSGTVDMNFQMPSLGSSATQTVHLAGSWRCAQ